MSKTQTAKFQIVLLVLILLVTAATSRFTRIKCALCKQDAHIVSWFEYQLGPWKNVPTLHPSCQYHIAASLAPNADMNMTEWLKIRGFYENGGIAAKPDGENLKNIMPSFLPENNELLRSEE